MTYFILVQALVALLFSFIWNTNNWPNVLMKMFFSIQVVWAIYLLIGPSNLIAAVLN